MRRRGARHCLSYFLYGMAYILWDNIEAARSLAQVVNPHPHRGIRILASNEEFLDRGLGGLHGRGFSIVAPMYFS
jgi:hypothetical protein